MAVLPIRLLPDPVLRQKARPVDQVTDEVRQRLADMLESMYAADGIGLAAPQVGDSRRLVVIDIPATREEPGHGPFRLVNPEITLASPERASGTEGCLSIPGETAEVERARSVTVRYLDDHGAPRVLEAEGLLSVCLQHEIDHLDGVLFIDHLSRLKREMIVKRMKKRAAEAETL